MRTFWAVLLISGAFLSSGCGSGAGKPAKSEPKLAGQPMTEPQPKSRPGDPKDFDRLQGTWQVTAIEAVGKPVPAERVEKLSLQYVFAGDKLTVRRPDRPDIESGFVLGKTPYQKTILIQQKPSIRAAYDFEGGKLRLCVLVDALPFADFPKDMVSKASPKTDLLTLERR